MLKKVIAPVMLGVALAQTCRDLTKEEMLKKVEACKAADPPPTCRAGQSPVRDPESCCFSCTLQERECTLDQLTACKEKMAAGPDPISNFRICDTKEAFLASYDKSACCYTCFPATAPQDQRPESDGTCTKLAIEKCVAATDVCKEVDGDTIKDGLSATQIVDKYMPLEERPCCKPCLNPLVKNTGCTLEQYAKQRYAAPTCAADEVALIDTEACFARSCKPSAPVCATTCGANEFCVVTDRTKEVPTKVCKRIKSRRFLFRAKQGKAAKLAALKALRNEEIRDYLKAAVVKYCSVNDKRQAKCEKAAEIIKSTKFEVTQDKTDETTDAIKLNLRVAEIKVADIKTAIDAAKPAARRLLETGDADTILDDALNGNEDFDVEEDTEASGTSSVAASLAAALACVVTVFRA